ncbi:hypothetical protein [Gracilibacillus sp. YIM 98692]|uniref:hypothetical protein n=1 Tax=Gracilibacillus sp. YIM 98692 TaxID=2663532 RepID=UPI00196A19EB|nr:hypothetical protein [Gracilibacillus sp. YIM 98692]
MSESSLPIAAASGNSPAPSSPMIAMMKNPPGAILSLSILTLISGLNSTFIAKL